MANFICRILVVNDDERIRMVSEQVLSSHDYEVRTASHRFEALALVRNALPDLIIFDLNMPNMSGFELLSIVRRRFSQLPVVESKFTDVMIGEKWCGAAKGRGTRLHFSRGGRCCGPVFGLCGAR
jgi:PleD family two-component response regulator